MSEPVQILLATRLFRGVSAEELAPIAGQLKLIDFAKGEEAIREGQVNRSIYVIVDGEFQVVLPEGETARRSERMADVELTRLQAGRCFGEFSVVDEAPASASVIATRPSQVVALPRGSFLALTEPDRLGKQLYRNLSELLIDKIRSTDRDCDLLLAFD